MANWTRIKRLRAFLETVPPKRLRMDKLLLIDKDNETIKQALEPSCGTVACMAGWTHCLFTPKTTRLHRTSYHSLGGMCNVSDVDAEPAGDMLGLDEDEACHMFSGGWSAKSLDVLTKRDVLRYLDQAIAAKDVMVTLQETTK